MHAEPNAGISPLVAFFVPLQSRAQPCCKQQLNKVNQQITEAYLNQDAASLLRLYAADAVSMPEYHATLFGKKAIAEYQQAWINSAKVTSYSRDTNDTTRAGHYLIETGAFSIGFTQRTKEISYDGKYLTVWQVEPGGTLKLLWGDIWIEQIPGSCRPATVLCARVGNSANPKTGCKQYNRHHPSFKREDSGTRCRA